MVKRNWKRFSEVLEEKQREIAQIVHDRDGIVVETTADTLDGTRDAAERELVIRNLAREAALLRDISAALQRIEQRSFGLCVQCEQPIDRRRLTAVPWAARCVRCQERAEHRTSKISNEIGENLLTYAV